MALVNQPAILPGAFAAEGDKNTIPANNDGLSGLASIAKGFPQITQVPLAQGGQPPQRQDFNGIFNLFSQFLLYAQNGGVYAYNNTLDYQPPAIIASDNVFYQCVAENGPSTSAGVQPVTNTTYWEKLVPDVAVMTGATASEAGKSGMVPAPAAGDQGKALLGDGTWELLIKAISEASGTITVTKSDGSKATIKQILKAIQDGNGNNIVNTYATKTELSTNVPTYATAIGGASAKNPAVIVKTYQSGATWYRVWSDGWVEQGGKATANHTGTTVAFPKPFSDTNITIATTSVYNSSIGWENNGTDAVGNITQTNFKVYFGHNSSNTIYWYACGKGA